jgi:signal transduction histidine kinase/DNA-binding response OmpR family regulator/CHASE3 domain sensor protein
MKVGLASRMFGAGVVVAVLVGAGFAILAVSIQDLRGSARVAHHSEEVVAATNALEKLVLDLETGQRGYVLTHDERFLEPWRDAHRSIGREADLLLRLLADEPEQRERAVAIRQAIQSYVQDYSDPLVTTARADPDAGKLVVAAGEGKRMVDGLRAQFRRLSAVEEQLADSQAQHTSAEGRRAIRLAAWGVAAAVALMVAFGAYLARAVVRPVRKLSAAAVRIAGGDLAARVPERAAGELGTLGVAFNAMAHSLEESRDELETQNRELELQASELEDQHSQLEVTNDELDAQRSELERALAAIAEEKERTEVFYGFGELIASQTELIPLAESILRELADFARAEVGSVYAVSPENDAEFSLVAARALDRGALPAVLEAASGLAYRALEERRLVTAVHGESGLRIASFGGAAALRHELHVPLIAAGRVLGVVTLARLGDAAFEPPVCEALAHLADQAAIAFGNALSLAESRRLVTFNRALLDQTPLGIRLVGADGSILLENATIRQLLSSFPEEILHGRREAREAGFADATTDPEGFREWSARLARDPGTEDVRVVELLDGRVLEIYGGPVRDHAGDVTARLYVVRDVTAEREAERLKSDLVATVSHELRTPLASVLGFAELLSTREYDRATQKKFLDTITTEASRLTALVNDFLDLQRMESGDFGLSLAPFDLAPLLRDEVALFSMQSASHELELDVPGDPVMVLGDRDRLAQVVANLLSNAIKYSPEGGVVSVAAAVLDGRVRVSVSDTGVGIPVDQQGGLFSKFFRVDSSDVRRIGGTGLGLALCREIVDAHGGVIGFESREGHGSTFWFEVPAVGERRLDARPQVLVVAPGTQAAALAAQLADADYAVDVAETGGAALERAGRDAPALICLDVTIPGEIDGWDLLARLKEDPRTLAIPIVVCSGGNGAGRAAALGAADFLAKPFAPARLCEIVERVLAPGESSVLVVDDDPAVRRLVVESLAPARREVREAEDGEEALRKVGARRPDAIVLDLGLPRLDGFDVIERLQEDDETRTIPVVVLTARRLSPQERQRLKSRAASLLLKSEYSAEQLRDLVARAIGR